MTRERLTQPTEETYPSEPENFVLRAIKRWQDRLRDNTPEDRREAYGHVANAIDKILNLDNVETRTDGVTESFNLKQDCKIQRRKGAEVTTYTVQVDDRNRTSILQRPTNKQTRFVTNGTLGKVEQYKSKQPIDPSDEPAWLVPAAPLREWRASEANQLAAEIETCRMFMEIEHADHTED